MAERITHSPTTPKRSSVMYAVSVPGASSHTTAPAMRSTRTVIIAVGQDA